MNILHILDWKYFPEEEINTGCKEPSVSKTHQDLSMVDEATPRRTWGFSVMCWSDHSGKMQRR